MTHFTYSRVQKSFKSQPLRKIAEHFYFGKTLAILIKLEKLI